MAECDSALGVALSEKCYTMLGVTSSSTNGRRASSLNHLGCCQVVFSYPPEDIREV